MSATMPKNMTIEIFDPPMCCPSGLCGPDIDPALLDINEAILKIKKEYNGQVKIDRYLLSQHGPKFMQNSDILALLKKESIHFLPATVINGKLVKTKAYPTYEELKQQIGG